MVYARQKRWDAEQERQDFRAGMITSAIYNVNRGKRHKAFTPQDFMPERKPAPKPMTVEASVNYAATLNRLLGGVDLRGKAPA